MKINKLAVLALLGAFLFNSCTDDNDDLIELIPEGDYTDGFFVVNEGGFNDGGTVSFISDDLNTVEQNIFNVVNPNANDLGVFTQSIFFDDSRAYVISNGSNLITVVDRYTFELIDVIDEGLSFPRYGTVLDGKAYVTNQDDYTTNADDYVAIIDLTTLTVEKSVVIGNYVEKIQESEGLLYIQGSAFGSGNKINVFDPSTEAVLKSITTAEGLDSFEVVGDVVYTIGGGKFQEFSKSTGAEVSSLSFTTLNNPVNLDVENGLAYFTNGKAVYSMLISVLEEPVTPLLTYESNSAFGVMYGFSVKNDRIYIADGGDFSSDSFVEIYTLDGELLKNIPVGLGPNGFYFN
ncbi:YncE family protein [Leeuwenhoekiella sp. W20_SRS_FM14]|uniref:YncE family protein n=1 Tax=Leeuwenhoekiella sp. W20_SRS_FM14 TaxID=3240270 RepID=UPI003F964EA4